MINSGVKIGVSAAIFLALSFQLSFAQEQQKPPTQLFMKRLSFQFWSGGGPFGQNYTGSAASSMAIEAFGGSGAVLGLGLVYNDLLTPNFRGGISFKYLHLSGTETLYGNIVLGYPQVTQTYNQDTFLADFSLGYIIVTKIGGFEPYGSFGIGNSIVSPGISGQFNSFTFEGGGGLYYTHNRLRMLSFGADFRGGKISEVDSLGSEYVILSINLRYQFNFGG